MKKELYQTIKIPEDVEVSLDGNKVKVKGPEGENIKEFKFANLDVSIAGKEFKIGHKVATKTEKRNMNTISAHIKNMIKIWETNNFTGLEFLNERLINLNISWFLNRSWFYSCIISMFKDFFIWS